MNKTTAAQQAKTARSLLSAQGILQRKCACGNHTVAGGECAECGKNKSGLQRKLTIGASSDPLEQEADRIADQVMAAPAHSVVSGAPPRIQRYAGQAAEGTDTAPASVDRVLASPGRPLGPALGQDMEQRFGHDFSQVRLHTDAAAVQSARDVNAHAYTVGKDIVFDAGRFAPGTHEGRQLLAHELAHVVQQVVAHTSAPLQINRKCAACEAEEEEKLQKKEAGSKDEIILRQEESPYYQLDQPAVGDFYYCTPPLYDRDQIFRALDKANLWVASAILKLDQFAMGGQTIEEETAVRLALRDNFSITETHPPETLLPKTPLKTILHNFVTIKGALNQTLNFFCASDCRPGELAWVLPNPEKSGLPPGTITTCLAFFRCDPLKQASTIIHERAHQALGAKDYAYEVSSSYDSLPTIMALENAESYAVAARQMFHGGIHGPGLSCSGTSRIRPLELLKLTPPPPRAPTPPGSRKRDPGERYPAVLGGKLAPPTPPTGLSPEGPTPVPTPTPSGAASGKTARVLKMETLRGCAYTVTYANQKEVDCDTLWKNENGTKPPKPLCGTSLVYDIISVSASGSKCPAKLEGLKVSENTNGDHGCTSPDYAWPKGSCIIGPGGKVSGCTDKLTLCGFTDDLKGDCTEIVDQEIEVGGQLAEEHEIIFNLKKSGKDCKGKVTRN